MTAGTRNEDSVVQSAEAQYRTTYDSADDILSEILIAIGELEDTDPLDLTVAATTIDPDALAGLFSSDGSDQDTRIEITFEFGEYVTIVRSDGTILVAKM